MRGGGKQNKKKTRNYVLKEKFSKYCNGSQTAVHTESVAGKLDKPSIAQNVVVLRLILDLKSNRCSS